MTLTKPHLRKSPVTGWWSCRRERDEFNGIGPTEKLAFDMWEYWYPSSARLLREASDRSSDKA